MKTYKGILYGFFETGTEGTVWTLIKDDMKGYEALESIKKGDHLKVFGVSDAILFDGVIKPDYEVGYMPYPLNPQYGQQCALGYWVHWIQSGWQPDDWAALFLHDPPLRAELTRDKE